MCPDCVLHVVFPKSGFRIRFHNACGRSSGEVWNPKRCRVSRANARRAAPRRLLRSNGADLERAPGAPCSAPRRRGFHLRGSTREWAYDALAFWVLSGLVAHSALSTLRNPKRNAQESSRRLRARCWPTGFRCIALGHPMSGTRGSGANEKTPTGSKPLSLAPPSPPRSQC